MADGIAMVFGRRDDFRQYADFNGEIAVVLALDFRGNSAHRSIRRVGVAALRAAPTP